VVYGLRNFANVGLGPAMLRDVFLPAGPGRGKWDSVAERRGYEALDPATAGTVWPEGVAFREKYLNEKDGFARRTIEKAEEFRRREQIDRGRIEPYLPLLFPRTILGMQLQVEFLESHGIDPIYLIPPSHEMDQIQSRLREEGFIPHLFEFNDPNEYPSLFEVDARYDHPHLTAEASALYSRYVADRFAEWLKAQAG
jgi:hypothetical protein